MFQFKRLAVVVAGLLCVAGAWSSTAGAVTWHNRGGTTFTATTGASTLSATGTNGLACPSGATMTGTAAATPFVGNIYPISGTMTFSNCQLGISGISVDCDYTLTLGQSSITNFTGDVDLTCGAFAGGSKLCGFHGRRHAIWGNPSPAVITFTTGGTLVTTNGAGSCPLGTNDAAHWSEMTYLTTSSNPPTLVRTS